MANNNVELEKHIYEIQESIIAGMIHGGYQFVQKTLYALTEIDFPAKQLKSIFLAIKNLYDHNIPINLNTLLDFFGNNNHQIYQFPNWDETIRTIEQGYYPSFEDFDDQLEILKNNTIKNQLNNFAQKILSSKFNLAEYSQQIFNLEKDFQEIITSKKTSHVSGLKDIGDKYIDNLNEIRLHGKTCVGTLVGYDAIDQKTNGFQPGDLIILAARPGTGKTALALNFAFRAAQAINSQKKQNEGKPPIIVIFSLEMSKEQLFQRFIGMNGNISINSLRTKQFNDEEFARVELSTKELQQLPILIDDTSVTSMLDIQLKVMQLKNEYDIKLVIVDYLQLIAGQSTKMQSISNRQQEVAAISRGLKLLARLANVPLIALSQLSRKIDERTDKRPLLSDLRDSGAIEQDADFVCFISKIEQPFDQNTGLVANQQNPIEEILFDVVKYRNGSLFSEVLSFFKEYGSFVEVNKNEG